MTSVHQPHPTLPIGALAPLARLGVRARRPDAEPGIAARYPAVRELSARAGTRVYVAHDVALDRLVVVKALAPAEAPAGALVRFRREVRLMARLQHPHVAPVLAAGRARGVEYYVMPFLGETSLAARLRDGALPLGEALAIARTLAGALHHVHRQGIVHRDVKPANVLLADGHPVLVDFGIACAIARAIEDERVTLAGALVGTPIYMSPEQCGGEAPVDARTDVYALGCVLYEMLTGQPPFAGRDDVVLCRRLREPAPRPGATREAVPAPVDRLVARALAPRPDDRFASAAELAAAIAALPSTSADAPEPGAGWPVWLARLHAACTPRATAPVAPPPPPPCRDIA